MMEVLNDNSGWLIGLLALSLIADNLVVVTLLFLIVLKLYT